MLDAFRRGRNRYEFFTEALQSEIVKTKRTADEILGGLERNEFVAYYQPQFDAKTLEPTSVFRFDYEKIRALLDRSPAIGSIFYRALAHFLSHRLRQTTTDLTFAREKNLRYF